MNAQRQSVHHVIAPCHHHAITPCHHVIIMSQQFGVGAVEQSDTSGAHEFAGETLSSATPYFFKDNVAPGVAAEVGSGLDLGFFRQKVHRTVAKVWFALQNVEKNCHVRSPFGR